MIHPLSLPSFAFARAPSAEDVERYIRKAKADRRAGYSFDAHGIKTLGGQSMDAWTDTQPEKPA